MSDTLGPRRPRGALAACGVVACSFVGGGCAVSVEGSFDDVRFAPQTTAVAILDAHDLLERNGALVPVERPRSDRRVHLWLSGADVPDDVDWLHLESERLLDLKKELAKNDLLVLQGLDEDALSDGDTLVASSDGAGGVVGDFSFAVSHGVIADDAAKNGLGGAVTVEVEASNVVVAEPRGGSIEAVVRVTRQRDVGQPANDLATGRVVFTLSLPFAPERLAEANFAVVAPIAACGAARGPGANAGCGAVDGERRPR